MTHNALMQMLLIGLPMYLGVGIFISYVMNSALKGFLVTTGVFLLAMIIGMYTFFITQAYPI